MAGWWWTSTKGMLGAHRIRYQVAQNAAALTAAATGQQTAALAMETESTPRPIWNIERPHMEDNDLIGWSFRSNIEEYRHQ